MKLIQRIEVADRLGECVLWDEHDSAVWWTDIEGRRLHRLDWPSGALATYSTPARLASFAFIEGRREILAGFEHGIAVFDPNTGGMGPLCRPDGLVEGLRLNDGRVDRQGRFWIGSMVERGDAAAAHLYCTDGTMTAIHLNELGIANGLAFSPDGSVCYFADSRERIIWRFALDPETGALSERTIFARSSGMSCPDGATVDSEGFLWSAQWGGGCVLRYSPDGRIDRVLEVPVSRPSCVAFGGRDLGLLFVTSAGSGLAPGETGAGDLFVYNVAVRGLPESRCRIGAWSVTSGSRR